MYIKAEKKDRDSQKERECKRKMREERGRQREIEKNRKCKRQRDKERDREIK